MRNTSPGITRIAHLSDLHILAALPGRLGKGLGMRFVSFGRALDPSARRRKLLRALSLAASSGARHFVVTGDLTEIGLSDQFETLAEILHESGIDPDAFVLLPGNHDAYTRGDAFARALEGPLAPFRRGAASPGKLLHHGTFAMLPLDVSCYQPLTRSAGELTPRDAEMLERRLADPALRDIPVVAALHHPPFSHAWRAWQWIDGLRGWGHLDAHLRRHPGFHVLHGHLHHAVDRTVDDARVRILGATATVDDEDDSPRIRLYDVKPDGLHVVSPEPSIVLRAA